jgi:hypothetical protein
MCILLIHVIDFVIILEYQTRDISRLRRMRIGGEEKKTYRQQSGQENH